MDDLTLQEASLCSHLPIAALQLPYVWLAAVLTFGPLKSNQHAALTLILPATLQVGQVCYGLALARHWTQLLGRLAERAYVRGGRTAIWAKPALCGRLLYSFATFNYAPHSLLSWRPVIKKRGLPLPRLCLPVNSLFVRAFLCKIRSSSG